MTTTPVQFLDHKPSPPAPEELSLVEFNATQNAYPERLCRTCTFSGNRTHRFSMDDIDDLLRRGEHPEEYGCTPDQVLKYDKVTDARSVLDYTEPTPEGEHVVAFVESCGWRAAPKCSGCKWLNRLNVWTPYTMYKGGPTRYHEVTVGGYCGLPHDGLPGPNDTRIFCQFEPRPRNIDPSCMSCEFNMSTSTNWMLDEFSMEVNKTDLDPFEMFLARRSAILNASHIGGAINSERMRLTSHPQGLLAWYRAEILSVRLKNGVELRAEMTPSFMSYPPKALDVDEVQLRFSGSGWTGWMPLHDEDGVVTVVPVWDQARAGVQIQLPRQSQFGLSIARRKRLRLLPIDMSAYAYVESELSPHESTVHTCRHKRDNWAPGVPAWSYVDRTCPRCLEARILLHPPAPADLDSLEWAVNGCSFCHPVRGACYFHRRHPYRDMDSGEVIFERPDPHGYPREFYPRLAVTHRDDGIVVVNEGTNELADMSLLSVRLPSLMRNATKEVATQLLHHFHERSQSYPLSAPIDIEVGYGAPVSMEPFKNYCALALERQLVRVDHDRVNPVTGHTGVVVKRMIPPRSSQPDPAPGEAAQPGIDFRSAMGDSFGVIRGSETQRRSDRRVGPGSRFAGHRLDARPGREGESWTDQMRQDEWIRGHNVLERLTEEELVNEALTISNVEHRPWVEPDEWHVTKLDCRGAPVDNWAFYTPEADRSAFIDYLDEPVEVPLVHADLEVPKGEVIEGIILEGEVERHDKTVTQTRRWLIYGYDNFKGGKRGKTDDANIFSFDHSVHMADEGLTEVIHAFMCPVCSEQFSLDDLMNQVTEDGIEYVCPNDDAPLLWVETSDESRVSVDFSQLRDLPKTDRGRRGIGSAVAGDSEAYQAQTRLSRMWCDHWQLKGSSAVRPIKLANLEPNRAPK